MGSLDIARDSELAMQQSLGSWEVQNFGRSPVVGTPVVKRR